jgi:hypothetical protein
MVKIFLHYTLCLCQSTHIFLTRFRYAEIKRQKREKSSPGVHNMYLIYTHVKTQRKIKNYFVNHVIFFGHISLCYICVYIKYMLWTPGLAFSRFRLLISAKRKRVRKKKNENAIISSITPPQRVPGKIEFFDFPETALSNL